jgi:hypothetical protein
VNELPSEIDLDEHIDDKGIRYIGKARRQPDGTWRCLAEVSGALCLVEVKIAPKDSSFGPFVEDARAARGRRVRDAFIEAAGDLGIEHPETPAWEKMPDHVREMYCRIAESVASKASVHDAEAIFSAAIVKHPSANRIAEIWCAIDKLATHAEARMRLALPTIEMPLLAPEPEWLTRAVDNLDPEGREVDHRTFACTIILARAFVHIHPEATATVERADDTGDVLAIRWDDAAGLRFLVSRPPNLRWPAVSARAYWRPDPDSPRLECRYARLAHDLLAMPYEKVRDA